MKKKLMAIFFGSALVLGACGGGEEEASFTDADELDEETVESEPIEDVDEVLEENEGEEATEGEPEVENAEEDLITTADAEQLVQQNCTSCHGADLEGAGSFPALNDIGSRLTAQEIVEVIEEGPGAMPPHIVTGEEAAAVAQYLATLE